MVCGCVEPLREKIYHEQDCGRWNDGGSNIKPLHIIREWLGVVFPATCDPKCLYAISREWMINGLSSPSDISALDYYVAI